MARPKSYKRDEVIGRVRDAFWKHGYQGLGIRAIEEETGLGRFAIRTEFGGKEGLMAEALEVYSKDTETYVYDVLAARDDVEAIAEVLEGMIAPHPDTMRHFGCLMVNTTVENVNVGSEVFRKATNRHFERLEQEVVGLIRRGLAKGLVKPGVDPNTAAGFVRGSVMAVMVMNRAAGDVTGGAPFVQQAVATIRDWAA